MNKGNK